MGNFPNRFLECKLLTSFRSSRSAFGKRNAKVSHARDEVAASKLEKRPYSSHGMSTGDWRTNEQPQPAIATGTGTENAQNLT